MLYKFYKEVRGMPLADVMRPKTLDEICGQKHLFAKNAPLRRIIDSGNIPSMVFFTA